MCSDAAFPNWPYTTLLASRVGNCTPSDRPFALHLPNRSHRIGAKNAWRWPFLSPDVSRIQSALLC